MVVSHRWRWCVSHNATDGVEKKAPKYVKGANLKGIPVKKATKKPAEKKAKPAVKKTIKKRVKKTAKKATAKKK